MSNIRVQTYAEKIVNKGGGMKGKRVWKVRKEIINGNEVDVNYRGQTDTKTTGSDYIIFNCPACGKRNKRVSYDAKVEEDGKVLAFRCNKCYNIVEVKRPLDLTTGSEDLVYLPGGKKSSSSAITLA